MSNSFSRGDKVDANPITLFELEDNRQPWEIAQAEQDVKEAEILRGLGVTPAEASLFNVLHYGLTVPPENLIGRASARDYSVGGRTTRTEMRLAFDACLAKGWLQHVDEALLSHLKEMIRSEGLIGPIYRYPFLGGVDFTFAGASLWLEFCRQTYALNPHLQGYFPSYLDTVHEKHTQTYLTRAAAETAMAEQKQQLDVVSIVGPTPIGPWRAQWWRRFTNGFQVEIEERRQWLGRAGGSGSHINYCHLTSEFPFEHARTVLQRHQIPFSEWLCMCNVENEAWSGYFANRTAELARRRLEMNVSVAECQAAYESCLQKNWLRIVNDESIREVRSLLAADPIYHPVPAYVECTVGNVDFSLAGAALYRQLSAEIFGDDWEDAPLIIRESYREEHHYSESQSGFQGVFAEIAEKGEHILAMQIVPLGPWCTHWWEQFPAGFRLELQISTRLN